jgi:hypothetical protein
MLVGDIGDIGDIGSLRRDVLCLRDDVPEDVRIGEAYVDEPDELADLIVQIAAASLDSAERVRLRVWDRPAGQDDRCPRAEDPDRGRPAPARGTLGQDDGRYPDAEFCDAVHSDLF